MGFLNDFGRGFSEGLQKRIDLKDQQDAKVKAEIQVLDYKDVLEQRAKEKAALRLAEQRKNYGKNPEMEPLNGTPTGDATQTLPSVKPDDFMSQFESNSRIASDAAMAGDTDYATGYKIQADVAKEKISYNDKQRSKAREDVTSVEGIVPAKVLIEEDAAAMKDQDTGLYNKYFGQPIAVNYVNPMNADDTKAMQAVKKSSVEAASVASILTSASADPNTNKSNISSAVLKSDAVNLVKYKNIMADPERAEEHEQAFKDAYDILENYPEAAQMLIKSLKITKPASLQDDSTQPVTLSNETPTTNTSTTAPTITEAEYRALPSGARYLAPDGTKRTKP